jgi:hypothetical protein
MWTVEHEYWSVLDCGTAILVPRGSRKLICSRNPTLSGPLMSASYVVVGNILDVHATL